TSKLWVYDFRTGQHFTLRQHKLAREHLQDFIDCFLPGKPREERTETKRFKVFEFDELVARDKANLDITWLRDPDAEDSDNLPSPEVIAQEIVDDLHAALNEFAAVAEALEAAKATRQEDTT
ncbi:MAG TPA: SAM-dependent DNA methyltransferase, partial [Pseudonocardiaceae bacterium]|nr:SAM-dependent DNA methyltransferase [Pseudonocardiaceae bacterium]